MRQLRYALVCVVFNVSGMMHTVSSIQKNSSRNIQLCFNNTPRSFGTTHFIVGYDEKNVSPKKDASLEPLPIDKKESIESDGMACIDCNRLSQSFFTTIHDLSPILLEIIGHTKKHLYIAAFTLTDNRIVDRVMDAHKKGVDVCIITDASNLRQQHSKIQILVDNNVPVWCYKPALNPNYKKNNLYEPFMHHKIIIGDDFVVTGSANFTKAGQKNNIENINVLRDRQTVDEHHAEFKRLKKFCTQCMPQAAA